MPKLSVVIPVYNEELFIAELLNRVVDAELPDLWKKEIIIVDDCSTDNTVEHIRAFLDTHQEIDISLFKNPKNLGKGGALNLGFSKVNGDYVLIQDADLEYDPEDYTLLLKPVLKANADVVYGSRFVGRQPHRVLLFYHYLGNKLLTFLSNLFTNLNLSDMEVCYKLIKRKYLKELRLTERGFGIEPELTAKLSRIKGIRFYEVGVAYYGRSYEEGKKITWKDGVHALYCILKYNLWAKI